MAEETTIDFSLDDPIMKEIFESFIIETNEILEKLDVDLIKVEKRPNDMELLNDIFRSFHTIKGTSGFIGLSKIQAVTHRCEDILNKLRKGEIKVNDKIMDGVLKGYDAIKEFISIIENEQKENFDESEILETLQVIIDEIEGNNSQTEEKPKPKNKKSNSKTSNKTKAKKTKSKTSKVPKELVAEKTIVKEEPAKLQPEKELTKTTVPPKEKGTPSNSQIIENTIRVDVKKLDDLLNIVSELVLGRNRLSQINLGISFEYEGTKLARDLAETTQQIDLMTTELQLAVMKTRMIKIGKVFNRFPRMIRDLTKKTGKEVQLIINGEETELDKTLIEEIYDPLVHMIRNSMDHGIESAEEREKTGKNEKGTITLSAAQEGNNIIITIEDDGGGIDPGKLKDNAVKKGLLSREKADELSKQDAYNLIFLPGFSTAQQVTNVSGRGVGMDVVKTNISKLRGIIEIESEVGIGTKFIMKIPLTLAIIQGLLVEVLSETIVIPLNSVVEVIRIPKEQIYIVNQKECINYRDSVLPLLSLDALSYNAQDISKEVESQYVVIVGLAEKKYGIKVNKLKGQEEIVIKSLGNYLTNIKGIAGSTIMGDGTVVMIVDISEIINNSLS